MNEIYLKRKVTNPKPSIPIHVAITRRVKPGHEVEYETALREFIQASFACDGVIGATMIVPSPGSDVREFGILRSFANEEERDDFYASPLFKAWDKKCEPITEPNSWTRKPLHGLEAWFRSPNPPPQWKMAIATFLGVFPSATLLNLTLGRAVQSWNFLIVNAVLSACVVVLLTWLVMPFTTHALHRWLHSEERKTVL